LGPYWLEEAGKTVTVNIAHYRDVIKNLTLNHFYGDLSETLSEGQLRMAWFMQHVGDPPNAAHDTIAYLKELFNFRLLAH